MQVNLLHHPDAFADVPTGLKPEANIRYAIGFLKSLHGRFGNWAEAIANYHSADAERGAGYHRRVVLAPARRGLGAGGGTVPIAAAAGLCAPGLRPVLKIRPRATRPSLGCQRRARSRSSGRLRHPHQGEQAEGRAGHDLGRHLAGRPAGRPARNPGASRARGTAARGSVRPTSAAPPSAAKWLTNSSWPPGRTTRRISRTRRRASGTTVAVNIATAMSKLSSAKAMDSASISARPTTLRSRRVVTRSFARAACRATGRCRPPACADHKAARQARCRRRPRARGCRAGR